MQIGTSRFGNIEIEVDDVLLFPTGLVGFDDCRHWVLLGDAENECIGWLQCVSGQDLAMPVVSPRRFVADYQVRVSKSQLEPLNLSSTDHAFVLSVISKNNDDLTLNLKAPIIINLDQRIGRQVITSDEQPLQYVLSSAPAPLRKSA